MLATTVIFVLLAALLVILQVRRTSRAACAADDKCPRCRATLPPGAARCPRCRVPLQVYDLVAAAPQDAAGGAGGAGAGNDGKVHAVVRADVCVGCGTCVPACPVGGAIAMKGKLAVINPALCAAHGKCAEACPTGAIVLSTGAAVHRVEVPEVGPTFQSNVPGVYIVGELGGRGLIKNAINEGRIAVESIARQLPPRRPRPDGDATAVDVAIVGAGPAGLSAALEAKRCGLSYVVLEQGTMADTVRKYPRHKFLLQEPVHIPLYGELWVADASKETLIAAWESIVRSTRLEIRTFHRVENIYQVPPFFDLATAQGTFRARRVVLAMGRRGTPRRLGIPGEDLAKVFYDVAEMATFAGRKVLVVGGGDSAIESALGLANQPGTRVTLCHRGDSFGRAKERNRAKLEAAVRAGKVELLLGASPREITRTGVEVEVEGRVVAIPNDDVIIRVGGDPPYPFLQRIGVRMVKKDIPLKQAEASIA